MRKNWSQILTSHLLFPSHANFTGLFYYIRFLVRRFFNTLSRTLLSIHSSPFILFPMYSTGSFISDNIEVHSLSFSERSHLFPNPILESSPKSISLYKFFLRFPFSLQNVLRTFSERSEECFIHLFGTPSLSHFQCILLDILYPTKLKSSSRTFCSLFLF